MSRPLVARLRSRASLAPAGADAMLTEAANEIERLTRENTELIALRDRDKAGPRAIIFFGSGRVAVFDGNRQQMPKYQTAESHGEAIEMLVADGIDWRKIPECRGWPNGRW